MEIDYNKYDLKWFVLNCKDIQCPEFEEYPYSFHETRVTFWNVFDNWRFKEAAVDLALDFIKGKFNLEELKKINTETPYDYKTNTFEEPTVRPEVAALKDDFEAFKYQLMRELLYQEHGRTEYEICVADWPPVYRNKEGKYISVYAGQEHEPIESVDMDKIDCYQQVLPNADIFANYVLSIVRDVYGEKRSK